jgi:hypothetical protein
MYYAVILLYIYNIIRYYMKIQGSPHIFIYILNVLIVVIVIFDLVKPPNETHSTWAALASRFLPDPRVDLRGAGTLTAWLGVKWDFHRHCYKLL